MKPRSTTRLAGRKKSGARSLFGEWPRVARRIRRARHLALLLDFDGTLVGFKKNPAEVRLAPQARLLLTRLARQPDVTVAFISGRRRADLRKRVAVPDAVYMGLHGFERRPGSRVSAASRRALERTLKRVNSATAEFPGVWAEDKHGCVVLHYRGVPGPIAAQARRAARRALDGENVRVLAGKKMLELLAPEIKGKGEAAHSLLHDAGDGALPIFLGDTHTDEMAFRALPEAITVKVGNHVKTQANYYVRDPSEVRVFLERLEKTLESRHKPGQSAD